MLAGPSERVTGSNQPSTAAKGTTMVVKFSTKALSLHPIKEHHRPQQHRFNPKEGKRPFGQRRCEGVGCKRKRHFAPEENAKHAVEDQQPHHGFQSARDAKAEVVASQQPHASQEHEGGGEHTQVLGVLGKEDRSSCDLRCEPAPCRTWPRRWGSSTPRTSGKRRPMLVALRRVRPTRTTENPALNAKDRSAYGVA